jgi:hypothetical protein
MHEVRPYETSVKVYNITRCRTQEISTLINELLYMNLCMLLEFI